MTNDRPEVTDGLVGITLLIGSVAVAIVGRNTLKILPEMGLGLIALLGGLVAIVNLSRRFDPSVRPDTDDFTALPETSVSGEQPIARASGASALDTNADAARPAPTPERLTWTEQMLRFAALLLERSLPSHAADATRKIAASMLVQLPISWIVGVSMYAHEARDPVFRWVLYGSSGLAVLSLVLSARLFIRVVDGESERKRLPYIWLAIVPAFSTLAGLAWHFLHARIAASLVLVIATAIGPIALQLGMLRGLWSPTPARRRRLASNALLLGLAHFLLLSTIHPNLCLDELCVERPLVSLAAIIAGLTSWLITLAAALMVADLSLESRPGAKVVPLDRGSADSTTRQVPQPVLAAEARWNALRMGGSDSRPRIGLALSGGGIRSTAVCLGALTRLADHKRIRDIHYVSSVSGGGWAAAAVLARLSSPEPWLKQAGVPATTEANDTPLVERKGSLRKVVQEIRHNREYLARDGLQLSADMIRPVLLAVFGALMQTLIDVFVAMAAVSVGYFAYLAQAFPKVTLSTSQSAKTAAGLIIGRVQYWVKVATNASVLLDHMHVRGEHLVKVQILLDAGFIALLVIAAAAIVCLFCQFVMVMVVKVPWAKWPSQWAAGLVRAFALLWFLTMAADGGRAFVSIVLAAAAAGAAYVYVKIEGAKLAALAGAAFAAAKVLAEHAPLITRVVDGITHRWQRILGAGITLVVSLDDLLARLWSRKSTLDPADLADGAMLVATLCGLAYLAVSMFIGRNRVSLHTYWRERLSAAFMTVAERDIGFEPLHRFDPREKDNIGLSAAESGWPCPIFNGAINAPGSVDDETRAMGVARFEMTPFHVGGPITGWAPTDLFGDEIRLSSAVAISAAAVNTQGGESIPRSLRPALATLNLRLGAWVRNPRVAGSDPAFRRTGHFTTMYAVREWLGENDEYDAQVLVSDGGHDDNLGIVALVERGCRIILAVDAAADPHWNFEDLAKAVRTLRRHGWEIDGTIATSPLRPPSAADPEKSNLSDRLAIRIELFRDGVAGAPTQRVTILYGKSGLTSKTDFDVLEYARAHPSFPQQTTADQFFDLTQFDAYLTVGECIGDALISEWAEVDGASSEIPVAKVG